MHMISEFHFSVRFLKSHTNTHEIVQPFHQLPKRNENAATQRPEHECLQKSYTEQTKTGNNPVVYQLANK